MTNANTSATTPVRSPFVLYAFGVLVLAWCVWLAGLAYGHQIQSRFVGPADDVHDSLTRSGYIAERLLPFDSVTFVGDTLAVSLCCVAYVTARLGARGVIVSVLCIVSLCLHGLALLAHSLVAG